MQRHDYRQAYLTTASTAPSPSESMSTKRSSPSWFLTRRPASCLYDFAMRRIESELNEISGIDLADAVHHPSRCDGPKHVWQTLCGSLATGVRKSTCISRCWRRTANWLAKFAKANTEKCICLKRC